MATVEQSNWWRSFHLWQIFLDFFVAFCLAHSKHSLLSSLSADLLVFSPDCQLIDSGAEEAVRHWQKLAVWSFPVKLQSSAAVTLAHRAKGTGQMKNPWWLSNIWKEVYLENEILIFSSFFLSWFFKLVLLCRQALIQPLHQLLSKKKQHFYKSISELILLGFK